MHGSARKKKDLECQEAPLLARAAEIMQVHEK